MKRGMNRPIITGKEKMLQGVGVGLVRRMIPSVKCLFRPGI